MTEIEKVLLPCPFCGNALEVSKRRYNPHARCVTANCKGAQLPLLNIDQPDDVARWNTRPAQTEQQQQQPVAVPESWWQLIHDTLRNYRMGTLDDGFGDGYPLIDAMTADGQPVSGGIQECTYLADEIWNALRVAPIAQTAPQPAGVVLPPQCTDKSKPVKYRKGWNSCLSEVFRLNRAQTEQQPLAWLIDWPEEPELGHYFSDEPNEHARSRPLYATPVAQATQRGETK